MRLFAVTLDPLPPWTLAGMAVAGVVGVYLFRAAAGPRSGLWGAVRSGLRLVASLVLVYSVFAAALLSLRLVFPELAIQVNPVWPWPMVLIMSMSAVGVVLGTYPQRLTAFGPWQRGLLLGLRLTAALLLMLAMLRPGLQWSKKNDRAILFPILEDVSRSMLTKDGPGGASRYESQQKVLLENHGLLEQLRKKVQVPEYGYSQDLEPIAPDAVPKPGSSGEPKGNQTALGFVLDALLKQHPNQPIAGVLMFGDFGQRALPPYDVDPRLVAQRLAELHIPVYTVPFGANNLSSSGRDLIAEELVVSPTVFVKNTVIVGAKIRALGAAGREQTVQLLVEQPTNRQPGQPAQMEVRKSIKIRPLGNEDIIPVELDFTPQQTGEFRVSLRVVPDEGEPIVNNNEVTTFITVLKGGLSIAYFDVARNERTPISNLAKSPDIQLDSKLIRIGSKFGEANFESEWFQPGKYDVYIIGDVPADVFHQPRMKIQPLQAIHDAVERGAGLLMIGGMRNFAAGGYAETPLAATLPIQMNPADKLLPGTLDKDLNLIGPQRIEPTSDGLNHFVMRIDSPARNLAKWHELPPLNGATKLGPPKPLAQILARNTDGNPLLIAQDFGRGRSMAFAGDTTFLWALAGQEEVSQRFWRQLILWLAHKELQGDSSIWLKLNERRFRPGQPVDLTFGAKSKDGGPIADAQFKVQVFTPKGEPKLLAAQQLGADHTARFTEALAPGEYTAVVEATHQGQSVGSAARSRFMVYEHDLELHNPAADSALAAELSETTGGKSLKSEDLSSFLRDLLKRDLQPDDRRLTTVSLWDNWLFVLIFVTIMTVEWFLRKSRGLV
ncbi:MAG: glutamine amidotransferase [Planctomycetota bacterium]